MTSRAIVIGSGFGGLAAAVRLRVMGWDVTVLEALDQPGGRARVFRQDGYTFDAGPTVITAPYLIDELFLLAGRDPRDHYTLAPVDPYYRVELSGGGRFDYVGDEARLLDQVRAIEPRDVDGYRRLAAHMERIFDVGYAQLADAPFDRLSEMLRVVPSMVQLESYRSVYGLVAKYLKSPDLRQVFSFQPLLVGGNPFSTTSIYALIHWLERKWGVHYAMGGTTSLVHALVGLLRDLGVNVVTDAPVARIRVSDGRATGVTLASGEQLDADLIVSNGDPASTYALLESGRGAAAKKSERMSSSMGLFVAYFGTRRRYPDIAHHTIVLGPRYKSLLADIFDNKVLADDFSLYLHRPTKTDPSMAPPGHDAWYVLSPVPNLQADVDWASAADGYRRRIFDALQARLLPDLAENITTVRTLDPRQFAADYRSPFGAAFGPEPVLLQSAWFRNHNKSPDVGGLYFVGAGTHPGAGVPGVLCSAKVLEKVVPRPTQVRALPTLSRAARAPRAA